MHPNNILPPQKQIKCPKCAQVFTVGQGLQMYQSQNQEVEYRLAGLRKRQISAGTVFLLLMCVFGLLGMIGLAVVGGPSYFMAKRPAPTKATPVPKEKAAQPAPEEAPEDPDEPAPAKPDKPTDKPASKPDDKPATKPDEKPAKPVVKPTKPDEKPTTKPDDKPAKPGQADQTRREADDETRRQAGQARGQADEIGISCPSRTMPKYFLSGKTERGKKVTDLVEARHADEAARLFRERGFIDVKLHSGEADAATLWH
jgi:cytoskeletal protein RodZ